MNRRSFLKAFVALPAAAAAVELAPFLPEVAPPVQAAVAAAPRIIFCTSLGEMVFATTPEMWVFSDARDTLNFVGELTWQAEETMIVERIDVELPGLERRVAMPAAMVTRYMMLGDTMTLQGVQPT